MRAMTGESAGDAPRLIQRLAARGHFDDLPKKARGAFSETILRTLPSLNRRLGESVDLPPAYGELAIHLAAAFQNFLIALHVERTPPEEPKRAAKWSRPEIAFEDDIPF